MTAILFRIDQEAIPETIDIVEWLKSYGTDLFLVQHQKPDNYHYHGYMKLDFSEKTFRRKIQQLLPIGGNKSYSIKTKIDNLDKYLSYCLYRKGDPIKLIINDKGVDLDYLKEFIPKLKEKKERDPRNSLESRFNEILKLDYSKCKIIKDYTRVIIHEYKKRQMVVNLQQIRQLTLSVYLNKCPNEEAAIDDLVTAIHADHTLSCVTDHEFSRLSHQREKNIWERNEMNEAE